MSHASYLLVLVPDHNFLICWKVDLNSLPKLTVVDFLEIVAYLRDNIIVVICHDCTEPSIHQDGLVSDVLQAIQMTHVGPLEAV